MRHLLVCLLLSLVGCMPAIKPQCTSPDRATLSSITRVVTFDGGNASGVVVGKGRVLTAAHVVSQQKTVLVRIGDAYYEAAVLALDDETDLALLAVDTGDLKPVRMSMGALREFEQVWAVGYPLAREQSTTPGRFQGVANGRLYTTAQIDNGYSGGGLLRCNAGAYELAGVVHGFVAYQQGDDYVNIGDSTSVSSDQILAFIEAIEGT